MNNKKSPRRLKGCNHENCTYCQKQMIITNKYIQEFNDQLKEQHIKNQEYNNPANNSEPNKIQINNPAHNPIPPNESKINNITINKNKYNNIPLNNNNSSNNNPNSNISNKKIYNIPTKNIIIAAQPKNQIKANNIQEYDEIDPTPDGNCLPRAILLC